MEEVISDKKAATEGDDDDDDADSTDEWHFSFEAMRELLPEKKDITVVDVGCGVSCSDCGIQPPRASLRSVVLKMLFEVVLH